MEEAIILTGLPVRCAWGDCDTTGRVKPGEHDGWYKSKMFRRSWRKRWFCPEHYEDARQWENRFYNNYLTPDPYTEEEAKTKLSTVEELYKLLD